MKHPSHRQWIDFARGLSAAPETRVLKAHLDAGCDSCASLVSSFHAVAQAAESELRNPTPDFAVRLVRVAFRAARRAAAHAEPDSRFERTFDSGVLALAAGVRNGPSERRMVYETGGYSLELALSEPDELGPPQLHGQLRLHEKNLDRIPVFMVQSGAVQSSAVTQNGGLFELSGDLGSPCDLWIFPDDHSCIAASWGPDTGQ